jgi:hypothetical protein
VPSIELNLPNGGRWDIWLTQVDYIAKLIKQFALKPVHEQHLAGLNVTGPTAAPAKGTAGRAVIWDPGIRGGIRVAHLHYKGQVYMLDERQWATFSSKVIADAQKKLSNVKAVSFENLVELDAAGGSIH